MFTDSAKTVLRWLSDHRAMASQSKFTFDQLQSAAENAPVNKTQSQRDFIVRCCEEVGGDALVPIGRVECWGED
jgi:hypothetical protein